MPQSVGIIGVFVTSHNLIEPLPHQREYGMAHAVALARIAQVAREVARQSMALVEAAQGKATSVAADLPTGKVTTKRLITVEGEDQLWYTICHSRMLR